MKRKQLVGIILFGLGGAMASLSFFFSIIAVDDECITPIVPSSGVRIPSLICVGSSVIAVGVAFVPFLLVGLGLYFIFQPHFSVMERVADAIERRDEEEAAAVKAAAPKEEVENKELEIPQMKGNDDLKNLTGSELQQELVRMKTIAHVLSSSQKKDSPPDQMSDILAKTHERIAAIELEIWNRQKPKV